MKIKCEHCGSVVDAKHEEKCHNCGAPFTDNKEYIRLLEGENVRKEAEKKLQYEFVNNTMKGMAFGRAMTFVIMLFVIAVFFGVGYFMYDTFTSSKTTDSKILNKIDTVSFGENSVTDEYEMKCDKISKYDNAKSIFNKKEDYDYYNFHIIFNNKTYVSLLSEIKLYYTDSDGNEDVVASREMLNTNEKGILGIVANSKGKYTGNVTFGIPSYVKDVTIKYKNTIIKIDNFKDKIE